MLVLAGALIVFVICLLFLVVLPIELVLLRSKEPSSKKRKILPIGRYWILRDSELSQNLRMGGTFLVVPIKSSQLAVRR